MYSNYLKVALRNIVRHKTHAVINVVGLAVGIACCLMILIWVDSELGFDEFHSKVDRLYRVVRYTTESESSEFRAITPSPLGPALVEELPEVVAATRSGGDHPRLVKKDDRLFQDDKIAFVDPSLFTLFSLPLLYGDSLTALTDPSSVVISESMSRKYFGDDNAVGQVLNIERSDYTISAIMRDLPDKSHLAFDAALPFESRSDHVKEVSDRWEASGYYTYVLLDDDASTAQATEKMNAILNQHLENPEYRLELQPITKVHLHSAGIFGEKAKGIVYVYMFSAMAILILIAACINFANLTTARSSVRATEIGVRKVMGARRTDLVRQFLAEAVIMSGVAAIIAFGLVEILLPAFSVWAGKDLGLHFASNYQLLLAILAVTGVTGLAAGAYPALCLSSLIPIRVLKGERSGRRGKSLLRRILVVTQFALSIFLLVCASLVYQQLTFMTSGDLGFVHDDVMSIYMRGGFSSEYPALRQELLAMPGVVDVTAGTPPVELSWGSADLEWEGKDPDLRFGMGRYNIDYQYISLFQMEMLKGRGFSQDHPTDLTEAYILNEAALSKMKLDDPIGKSFAMDGRQGSIIGVVKDFHIFSMHDEIIPLALQMDPDGLENLIIRTTPEQAATVMSFIESRWRELSPEYAFDAQYLDATIEGFYRSEHQTATLVGWSAGIAVVIACLGLFGLASYMVERRTKEIGIRKLLGAGVTGIVRMLSTESTWLIIAANALAWPAAYYAADLWLARFAYTIEINLITFFTAGFFVLAIALVIIAGHTIRAARANPVNALRNE
ncbi:MAG: ABC transporter permease [candidate division Zixibacteria bacterium]|nr:ABC transporter permease [candidate division Zixibacteria bacterium]MDH3937689.1 ABC transporter permease [candidate division Zixibacteria bacterium]MDH4034953.1 ABC transporter permease [candidate division Zixibacteria bacterium]